MTFLFVTRHKTNLMEGPTQNLEVLAKVDTNKV